ncbi:MAG TPA: OmpH family outer membrane protein [Flavobacteriaceae bacterium]|nr:OmpH family outer membrane protein [Flavobacteriaceae bacterium]MCB9212553.1 OmpH family outer membrane protein [Alteromonas sp.]HPF10621.1 OmpH family outer membrane protein [Flavobacteriaceae bacterium]HQU20903.1 OmpH family outer membrane protein [Flavobacteriaceae bacterium]HQU64387.1 OmpH family outer membrane protein [Flavobacteriaceae bacterium]
MKYFNILFLFICMSGFAQTKVGTIDIDFILSKMPELVDVQKQVETYTGDLQKQFDQKMTAYQTAVGKFKEDEALLTIKQKKERQDSLISMEDDLNKFQQNGNQLIVLKQEEFMQPLYDKVGGALEKVAQAEAYTQVLRRDNNVVYIDNRFDLTLAVLKEMGIEVKQEE